MGWEMQDSGGNRRRMFSFVRFLEATALGSNKLTYSETPGNLRAGVQHRQFDLWPSFHVLVQPQQPMGKLPSSLSIVASRTSCYSHATAAGAGLMTTQLGDPQRSFPRRLRRNVADSFQGSPVNPGMSGQTTSHMLV
jgi:hypothetical protein